MLRRAFLAMPILVMSLLALPAAAADGTAPARPLPPPAEWVPQDAVLSVEVARPEAILDVALDPQVLAGIKSLPQYQQASAQPGFRQFVGIVGYLEGRLGTDWQTAVRRILGGGISLSVCPGDGVLLTVDSKDPQLLAQLHEIFLGFARDEAAKQGQPDRVASHDVEDVTVWTFNGGKQVHAIVGGRLLLSNKEEVLKAALDRRTGGGESLAALPAYQQARLAVGADAAATVFVNMAMLKNYPPVAKALSEGRNNPLAALLLADLSEALRESTWLAMGLSVEREKLTLRVRTDGKPAERIGPASFALPADPAAGALPNLEVPRAIARLAFYRDLHKFYAAKDELFPERTSGLIFFENMMGIFFSGRNLTDEVLAQARPEIRAVVAEQAYDTEAGTPDTRIPAFAIVFRMRDPERFKLVAEEAWQKALGLVNFSRGQKALPGLIIDRVEHDGEKFSTAYFSTADVTDKEHLDVRFNFRPSLAAVGEYLIVSSTDGLAMDLIDAVKKEAAGPARPVAGVHSLVEVDGGQLASILEANRDSMVRNNMVEKGNSRQQAETEIGVLLTLVRHLGKATLTVGDRDGRPIASVELRLNLPK